MSPESMDLVFRALASRPRRKLLDLIKQRPGSCVSELCAEFDVSRIAVMKHLRVLEEAQLIVLQKRGRRREIYFNVVPIQLIYDRWTSEYSGFWAAKAVDLKFFIESGQAQPTQSPQSQSPQSQSPQSQSPQSQSPQSQSTQSQSTQSRKQNSRRKNHHG